MFVCGGALSPGVLSPRIINTISSTISADPENEFGGVIFRDENRRSMGCKSPGESRGKASSHALGLIL